MIPGRADTHEKKAAIIGRILVAWQKAPQLRLGQLISNATANELRDADIFYVEDEPLATMVEEAVKKWRGGK